MFTNTSEVENQSDKNFRQLLKESLLNELTNAQSTLKTEHQIYDLWKGTERFFCTYSFYVDYLDLKEFKALVNECKDMNERDLIF